MRLALLLFLSALAMGQTTKVDCADHFCLNASHAHIEITNNYFNEVGNHDDKCPMPDFIGWNVHCIEFDAKSCTNRSSPRIF